MRVWGGRQTAVKERQLAALKRNGNAAEKARKRARTSLGVRVLHPAGVSFREASRRGHRHSAGARRRKSGAREGTASDSGTAAAGDGAAGLSSAGGGRGLLRSCPADTRRMPDGLKAPGFGRTRG
ncbi:hypothetical protein NDU88_006653 [Pleurodeles waltl]|uniref:Uncharacterized protein n=1 Tax=Pleurodeles waltl TaxID=8319 RepID=A0AAV7MDM6_PLEWA|nr:hypothetical protein NDU88_006653 [Pleurodeles waltl]